MLVLPRSPIETYSETYRRVHLFAPAAATWLTVTASIMCFEGGRVTEQGMDAAVRLKVEWVSSAGVALVHPLEIEPRPENHFII